MVEESRREIYQEERLEESGGLDWRKRDGLGRKKAGKRWTRKKEGGKQMDWGGKREGMDR